VLVRAPAPQLEAVRPDWPLSELKKRDQSTSNEIERWAYAKQRIRAAYARTNSELIFVWRDVISDIDTRQKSNEALLELLADYAELCADNLIPDDSEVDVNARLDDRLLEITFQLWRKFDADMQIIENRCCYCDSEEEPIYKCTSSRQRTINEDIPLIIFVCSSNDLCLEKAHSNGYTLDRSDRWRKVFDLSNRGRSRREIAEKLHIGLSTVSKDLRTLRRADESLCNHCGESIFAKFSDVFQYSAEINCPHCGSKVRIRFYATD